MNRHDRGFHFRYWTSKTDHYAKSYPDFSLGWLFNSETLFICWNIYIWWCITVGLKYLRKPVYEGRYWVTVWWGGGGVSRDPEGLKQNIRYLSKTPSFKVNLRHAVKHTTYSKCGALTTEEQGSHRDWKLQYYLYLFPSWNMIGTAPIKPNWNPTESCLCIRKCQTNPCMTYTFILEQCSTRRFRKYAMLSSSFEIANASPQRILLTTFTFLEEK